MDELDVICTLDGEPLDRQSGHGYYVRPRSQADGFQGFVVWAEPGWPPGPGTAQSLAMALADTLRVNLVETILAFITSDDQHQAQLLRIAGAFAHYQDVCEEIAEGVDPPIPKEPRSGHAKPTPAPESERSRNERPPSGPDAALPAAPPVPLYSFDSLCLHGEPLIVVGEQAGADSRQHQPRGSNGPSTTEVTNRRGPATAIRAPAGTDLSALDALGMKIAVTYEVRRLQRVSGSVVTITDGIFRGLQSGDSLVVEVHTPRAVARAEALSEVVNGVMKELEAHGISRVHPGFDLLTIRDGEIDRMIELKSSGVDARVQAMSWNEWKSASRSSLRAKFWLYLVGNLRADLDHASPYVRAINDPFGSLVSETVEDRRLQRAVQLRVREFIEAEHLDLTVTRPAGSL